MPRQSPRLSPGPAWRFVRQAYSHEHTSIRLAAQAASRATVSATCTRSPEVLKVVAMTQNIRRFYPGSLADYFCGDSGLVYDSGTPAKTLAPGGEADSRLRMSLPPDRVETLTQFAR